MEISADIQFQDPAVLEVGTILKASWGYDQTNIDFYVVDKVTAKMVTFHQVGSTVIDGDGWTGHVVPDTDQVLSGPIRRKFNRSNYNGGEIWISIESYSMGPIASVWSGRSASFSNDR